MGAKERLELVQVLEVLLLQTIPIFLLLNQVDDVVMGGQSVLQGFLARSLGIVEIRLATRLLDVSQPLGSVQILSQLVQTFNFLSTFLPHASLPVRM